MISLQRKLALRAQASLAHGTERSLAALARTTQAAHSTVAVGDSDVPLVDTVQDARDSAELLPFLEDGTSLAGDDAWEAWDQSEFAVDLAHQLEGELATAKADLDTALRDASDALEASGLAQSDAANAVTHAAEAANAAAQAVQDALAAHQMAEGAAPSWNTANPIAADASGKPIGSIWYVRNVAGRVIRMWELTALGWVARPFDETVIPQLAIGSGTYGTLAGDRLVANSVTAAQIQALAITATEIASNAVTAVKLAANSVTAAKISAGAVTTAKLDALAVTAEKLAVGAIIADKIAAGAITAAKLAATAIDGMTITGALIRTAPTGQRLQLDSSGLQAFRADGSITAALSASTGGLELAGDLLSQTGLRRSGLSGGGPYSWYDGRHNALLQATANGGTVQVGHNTNAVSGKDSFVASLDTFPDEARLMLQQSQPGVSGTTFLEIRLVKAAPALLWASRGLEIRGRVTTEHLPFAMSAGRVPARSVPAGDVSTVTVTFPAGRFTQPPIVTTAFTGGAREIVVSPRDVSSTSFTAAIGSMAIVARTVGAEWIATQMSAAAAAG